MPNHAKIIKAWHFTNDTLRDGRPVVSAARRSHGEA